MYADPLPSPMRPGFARIAVWIALGSLSWSILGAVVIFGIRLVG